VRWRSCRVRPVVGPRGSHPRLGRPCRQNGPALRRSRPATPDGHSGLANPPINVGWPEPAGARPSGSPAPRAGSGSAVGWQSSQVLLALGHRPTDESIPHGDFPGGCAKDHHRQLPPPDIPSQILHVLSDRAVETAIMVLSQQLSDSPPQLGGMSQFQIHGCSDASYPRWGLKLWAAPPAEKSAELARTAGPYGSGAAVTQSNPGPGVSKATCGAAMSLSRPAPLRQFQSSHRRRESAVRCQPGCCAIKARNSVRSSLESVRPWRQIGSTALRFYVIRGPESRRKRPNSSSGAARQHYGSHNR